MTYTRTLRESFYVPLRSYSTTADQPYNVNIVHTGTKTGSKVEGWKSKIERGLTASSPYYLDMAKVVKGRPEFHRIDYQMKAHPYAKYFTVTEGHPASRMLTSTVSHLPVSTSKARSMALSKLYKKLESDRSEMNAYASLAEITDVLRQFGRPFGSLVDAFLRHENRLIFERRRLVGSKTWKDEKFAQIAANTWLETSFGLLPLLSDAESLAKALGRWQYELSDNPKLRDRMRSRALESAATHVVHAQPDQVGGYKFTYTTKTETEARSQYVVGLTGEVRADFGSNERLLELLGLEGRNIPLAVWEATPWSWLVDYGTNVQQILQAGATITSRVKWIVLTEVTRTVQHISSTAEVSYDKVNYRLLNAQSRAPNRAEDRGVRSIRTTLNRTLPATLGVPPLYFKSPIGDVKKMANLLALAVTRSKDRTTWLS